MSTYVYENYFILATNRDCSEFRIEYASKNYPLDKELNRLKKQMNRWKFKVIETGGEFIKFRAVDEINQKNDNSLNQDIKYSYLFCSLNHPAKCVNVKRIKGVYNKCMCSQKPGSCAFQYEESSSILLAIEK